LRWRCVRREIAPLTRLLGSLTLAKAPTSPLKGRGEADCQQRFRWDDTLGRACLLAVDAALVGL